jgi:hypothetical protein
MAALLGMGLSACSGNDEGAVVITPTPTPTVTPTPSMTPTPTPPPAARLYGIRGERELVRFDPDSPETVTSITDFPGDERVVGLDLRPADNQLYAVTESGALFLIEVTDTTTPLVSFTELQPIRRADMADPFTPDARIGTDFNPAANALRLIDASGNNLRVPTAALTNPPPETSVDTFVDGIMGYRQGAVAAAYTQPAPGAEGTTLYVADLDARALYRQNANEGELTQTATFADTLEDIGGYDVFQATPGDANEHFALLQISGGYDIYALEPEPDGGAASDPVGERVVDLGDAAGPYRGLAVSLRGLEDDPLTLAVDESAFRRLWLLNAGGSADQIETFDEQSVPPLDLETEFAAGPSFTVTGLAVDERLVGLDVRTTAMNEARANALYALTSQSRVVALVEDGNMLVAEDTVALSDEAEMPRPLLGERFGVDFNPRADLLRIVSDSAQNLRVNLDAEREVAPIGGMPAPRVAGYAANDRTLRIVAPNPPQIVATAYRAAPLVGSFQFALDARDSQLLRVAVPNDGALVPVGPLTVSLPDNAAAEPLEQSFDIAGDADGLVYAALAPEGDSQTSLYLIDLDTGEATRVGLIGAAGAGSVSSITVRIE